MKDPAPVPSLDSAPLLDSPPLRCITYLTPSIPAEFFERVAAYVAEELGTKAHLAFESCSSGPMRDDFDPFAAGTADIGFLCSPSYLYLSTQTVPSVELVPAGFVFEHPQSAGRPVYFSDVVVRRDQPARQFEDLAGTVFGFNDRTSLSGYFAVMQHLQRRRQTMEFFAQCKHTGSHLDSIDEVRAGTIDCAAIDSTVLADQLRTCSDLEEHVRVVQSLGPHPIQPTVVRTGLDEGLRRRIAASLLRLDRETCEGLGLDQFGLTRCVPTSMAGYADERRALQDLGEL